MDTTKQVRAAAAYAGVSLSSLAQAIGTSPQAFSQRLTANTLRPGDLEKIGQAIGAEYISLFRFPDGRKI